MKAMQHRNTKSWGFMTFLIGFFALLSFGAFAQHGTGTGGGTGGGFGGGFGNKSPEERAKMITQKMKEQLKLTADQEKKTYAINLKYAKKNEEVRKLTDEAAMRKTIQTNNKDRDNELKGVFTADQFKSYQKMLEERKAQRQGKN
jgi:hypothetical protein